MALSESSLRAPLPDRQLVDTTGSAVQSEASLLLPARLESPEPPGVIAALNSGGTETGKAGALLQPCPAVACQLAGHRRRDGTGCGFVSSVLSLMRNLSLVRLALFLLFNRVVSSVGSVRDVGPSSPRTPSTGKVLAACV